MARREKAWQEMKVKRVEKRKEDNQRKKLKRRELREEIEEKEAKGEDVTDLLVASKVGKQNRLTKEEKAN